MLLSQLGTPATRVRVLTTRFLAKFGFREDSFLLVLACVVGVVTAVAAVGFHELIQVIRDLLYRDPGERLLYGRGLVLLVLWPTLGGLGVGVLSRLVFREREGHGIVDVMESVVKSSGFQNPRTAVEKILTAGLTIGTGGSTGAEGPIVQIGAAIASGVGQTFRLARNQMPLLIGCGTAAGISAIFNAPFGGVLFTLEVILQDFSIRTFTPIVVSSVIAQVTTLAVFELLRRGQGVLAYQAIFAMPAKQVVEHAVLDWAQVGNFVVLGLICGAVGLAFAKSLSEFEHRFHPASVPKYVRPAIGGLAVGLMGVAFVLVFGRLLMHTPKPLPFAAYPMPAFFSDSYGAIQLLLAPNYPLYSTAGGLLLLMWAALIVLKVLATVFTVGTGGAGGVIAPSLFLGAASGAIFGTLLGRTHLFAHVQPEVYALVGMGAVLAAVVHAPLASVLICFELTQDYKVMVPAMLACIVATGIARVVNPDSVYTATLRLRGVRVGRTDFTLLRRMTLEQVSLEPASVVRRDDPFQKVLDLTAVTGSSNFVVLDEHDRYAGMIVADDLKSVLLDREAIPLLVVSEMLRGDIPTVKNTDDFATVLDAFGRYDVSHLPVSVALRPTSVIGLVSRSALMRTYQKGLSEPQ